jgi:hypothetical protein
MGLDDDLNARRVDELEVAQVEHDEVGGGLLGEAERSLELVSRCEIKLAAGGDGVRAAAHRALQAKADLTSNVLSSALVRHLVSTSSRLECEDWIQRATATAA